MSKFAEVRPPPTSTPHGLAKRWAWVSAAIVVAAHLLLLGRAVHSGFALDDYAWLEAAGRENSNLADVLSFRIAGYFRPTVNLTWWFGHIVAGNEPWSYHVVNLVLDVGCAILIMTVLRRFGLPEVACLLGGLAFATHSSHTEVACWISGRTASVMVICWLVSLERWTAWRRDGHWLQYVTSVTFFCLALLSKEEAVVLLPIQWLLGRVLPSVRERSRRVPGLLPWLPPAVALTVMLLVHWQLQAGGAIAVAGHLRTSPLSMAIDTLSRFPRLFLAERLVRPPCLGAGVAILGVLAAYGLRGASREQVRMATTSAACAVLALLPTSVLSYSGSEGRYLYLASVFAAFVIGTTAGYWRHARLPQRVAIAVFVTACVVPQPYRLYRSVRYWDYGELDSKARASLLQLAPTLGEAVARGRTILAVEPPVHGDTLRAMFAIFARVPLDAVSENPSDSTRQVAVRWEADGFHVVR